MRLGLAIDPGKTQLRPVLLPLLTICHHAVRGFAQGFEQQGETIRVMCALQKDLGIPKRTLVKKFASVGVRLGLTQDMGSETAIPLRIEAIEQIVTKMHARTTQVEQKVSGMKESEAQDGRFLAWGAGAPRPGADIGQRLRAADRSPRQPSDSSGRAHRGS